MFRNTCGVWARAAALALLALSAGPTCTSVQAKTEARAAVLQTVTLDALPAQGRDMMALIEKGGPFKYNKGRHGVRQPGKNSPGSPARFLPRIHRSNARSK
jgi:guanyl-specific ribonuclease Sa